jgi:type I restriction enzyme M protein
VFYGAGVPACLLILSRNRPLARRDKVLLVYAARHYRELSNQNELRPQDVMRILVHYHAYGDSTKVPELVASHSGRIREEINQRELEEIERLEAEYKEPNDKFSQVSTEIAELRAEAGSKVKKTEKDKIEAKIAKLETQRQKLALRVKERDERITDVRRRAEEDRNALAQVGDELGALYGNIDELSKHARLVPTEEIRDNEFNLNIPRYVDTFEPEPRVLVRDAMTALDAADAQLGNATIHLRKLLRGIGYGE